MDKITFETGHALSLHLGATAFILTSLHGVLLCVVFYKSYLKANASPEFSGFLLIATLVMSASWLAYLWPLDDLFIRIALILEMTISLALLMPLVYSRIHNT
jgi:hypothetical protein